MVKPQILSDPVGENREPPDTIATVYPKRCRVRTKVRVPGV